MKSLRKILLVGILLGLVGGLVIATQDYTQQVKAKTLLPVLDYDSLVEWSKTTGSEIQEILDVAFDSYIKSVAITELKLSYHEDKLQGFFEDDIYVSAFSGSELIKDLRTEIKTNVWTKYLTNYDLAADNIYLFITSDKRAEQLFTAGVNKYGDKRIKKLPIAPNKVIIEVTNSESLPVNGLGFDPEVITLLKNNSFNIVPRPFNAAYSEEDKQILDNYFKYIQKEFNPSTIIFAGEEGVLGMPVKSGANFLGVTASNLRKNDQSSDDNNLPLYGHVEMAVIDGDKKLAKLLNYELGRVHSISSNEWKERYNTVANEATVNNVVERYSLAINDRSVHILYIRPFLKSASFNEKYFKGLAMRSNYSIGVIDPVPGRENLPSIVLWALGIGVGCALLLLFVQIFNKAIKLTYVLLGLGIVGVTGIAFVAQSYHILLQKIIALASAIVFPTLAIVIGFLWLTKSETKTDLIKKLLVVFGVTLVGGVYVHSSLAILRFMTSIDVFPMVKIALLMPIPLTFLILILNDDAKNSIGKLLNMNIKMYHAVIAGIAVVALGLLVIRSGNNPSIGVTGIELKIRAILQKVLVARPRFKEFAIGNPMIILALWLQYKNKGTLIPLTVGAIGLSSMVNTFAHLHKPLWMALLTSFNGIWVGVLVGVLFILIYEILDRFGLFEIIE